MCKYCNPDDERRKSSNWENLDLENSLGSKTTAYIVPADTYNRACLVFNNCNGNLVYIVLNYCPHCGAKLPE